MVGRAMPAKTSRCRSASRVSETSMAWLNGTMGREPGPGGLQPDRAEGLPRFAATTTGRPGLGADRHRPVRGGLSNDARAVSDRVLAAEPVGTFGQTPGSGRCCVRGGDFPSRYLVTVASSIHSPCSLA